MDNLLVEAKIGVTWYLFGRRAEERGARRLVDKALSLRSFRADFEQGLFYFDGSVVRFFQYGFQAIIRG